LFVVSLTLAEGYDRTLVPLKVEGVVRVTVVTVLACRLHATVGGVGRKVKRLAKVTTVGVNVDHHILCTLLRHFLLLLSSL
jgi:hypothetical protein